MRKEHWSKLEGQERAAEALGVARRLWDESATYRDHCRGILQRYHGTALQRYDDEDRELGFGLTRSMVSTVVSRIGALQAPRAQFVTSDAEWSTRRKASRLDDFFDALSLQECQPYSSVHDLRIAVFQDAVMVGRGWAQMSADEAGARIVTERVLPWEVMWDAADARYGCPREWWRCYPIARSSLSAWYPDDAQHIEDAASAPDDGVQDAALDWHGASFANEDRVMVYECWRSSAGQEEGAHLVLLDARGGPVALLDEGWDFSGPPLIGMQWDHPVIGARGLSLSDEVAPIEGAVNEHLWRMQDVIRRTSLNTLLVQESSLVPEQTIDASVVKYVGSEKPELSTPAPFDATHMQWLQSLWGKAFELTGIGQMAATGERQPGMSSGAAIRASATQQDLRFAWLTRQQGDFIVQWAKWGNRLLGKLSEAGVDVVARVAGAKSMRSMQYKSLELGEDDFLVQVHPVSEAKGSPAARLEGAEELLQRGLLTPQQYSLARSGSLDLPYWQKWASRQEELIDSYIDRWLDATPEEAERIKESGGYYDEERGIPMVPVPEHWLDIGGASVQVALAYMEAQMDGAPDYVLGYLRTFLAGCDQVAKEIAAAQPPPPPTDGGPMQGAPGPTAGVV